MNIVITGANGFVGKHLVNELLTQGHSVIGIGIEPEAHPALTGKLLEYASCNLAQAWSTIQNRVDGIIHLAGLAAVGPSFDKPQDYIHLNSSMVTNMCEYYLNEENSNPRILIVSSGSVYDSTQQMPITETSPISLSSPYSVSKILTENQAAYYNTRGLDCVVVRPFNHIGPGQAPGFLLPDLADKIMSRTDESVAVKVGNLKTKRDYTDVRDVARAYVLLATSNTKPQQLVYNVCSGQSIAGTDILRMLVASLGIPQPVLEIDQALIRPTDIMDIYGDASALKSEFGWKPEITISQTIQDFTEQL